MDSFNVQILADGTIKMTTDAVGAANHANAEEFFKMVARLSGGDTARVRRADAHQHTHQGHSHGAGEHEHSHN